jgi:type III secretion protein L
VRGAGGIRRLGERLDAVPLALAEAALARRREAERAAWTVAERVAYGRALAAEEGAVVALACEVAQTILGREAAATTGVLRDVTARALARVRRARTVVLRVHPDDAEAARGAVGGWLPEGMRPEEVAVVGDDAVGRGGVVVETELGRVDARLERQLEEIARILEGGARVV